MPRCRDSRPQRDPPVRDPPLQVSRQQHIYIWQIAPCAQLLPLLRPRPACRSPGQMIRRSASRSETKDEHVRLSTAPAYGHRHLSPTTSFNGGPVHRHCADRIAEYAHCCLTVGLCGSDRSRREHPSRNSSRQVVCHQGKPHVRAQQRDEHHPPHPGRRHGRAPRTFGGVQESRHSPIVTCGCLTGHSCPGRSRLHLGAQCGESDLYLGSSKPHGYFRDRYPNTVQSAIPVMSPTAELSFTAVSSHFFSRGKLSARTCLRRALT
ncbi:hypothetical protein RKD30_006124 [Streptomyces pristinaespiralis]